MTSTRARRYVGGNPFGNVSHEFKLFVFDLVYKNTLKTINKE